MKTKPRANAAFRWTDEQWSVLEQKTPQERFEFVLKRCLDFKLPKRSEPKEEK